jgi:hypothetical protein
MVVRRPPPAFQPSSIRSPPSVRSTNERQLDPSVVNVVVLVTRVAAQQERIVQTISSHVCGSPIRRTRGDESGCSFSYPADMYKRTRLFKHSGYFVSPAIPTRLPWLRHNRIMHMPHLHPPAVCQKHSGGTLLSSVIESLFLWHRTEGEAKISGKGVVGLFGSLVDGSITSDYWFRANGFASMELLTLLTDAKP